MPIPFIIAGAAAVAAAVGGKKAYDGYQTKSEADDIIERAKSRYAVREKQLKNVSESTEEKLQNLGELELKIGESFGEFKTISQELLNKLNQDSDKDIQLSIPEYKLKKIEQLTLSAMDFLGTAVASGAAGAAASFAVYSGVMAFAAASTGTPIAALSGAAAYNATMAAIGGGALSAGGLGMAGGAMILGAAAAAPALLIAGWAYASHAEKALENAKKARKEVDEAIKKMDLSENYLQSTNGYVEKIHSLLDTINKTFNVYFCKLKKLHEKIVINGGEKVANALSEKSLRIIHNGYLLAALMTDIISTPLFVLKEASSDGAIEIEVDENGFNVINQEGLDNVLCDKYDEYSNFKNENDETDFMIL
jgi:hypothetical protein